MFFRTALLSTLVTAGLAASAFAGECPADKVKTDAVKPVDYPAKGVTDTVLASNDLSKEKVALAGHLMRVRKLVIQPGGIVPWHSHADRPALIYIINGEIVEHASNCEVPIVHKAGDVARETHLTSHWWQNNGSTPVTLLSFDIWSDPNDHNM
ncbi:MAG: cupin domain-containing protein [Alphaproteobacteria bacterium]|nr:cupin domain-containing protein [Alphaproteobacteria bacterium]